MLCQSKSSCASCIHYGNTCEPSASGPGSPDLPESRLDSDCDDAATVGDAAERMLIGQNHQADLPELQSPCALPNEDLAVLSSAPCGTICAGKRIMLRLNYCRHPPASGWSPERGEGTLVAIRSFCLERFPPSFIPVRRRSNEAELRRMRWEVDKGEAGARRHGARYTRGSSERCT